ncbi:hypothetical protein [Parerythrobacter aestuarii]|uniref:hypothetical protein n=1 Tax=Parerythrobacter aestuarii TaxID=3020909 RepID=UPI0024DE4F8C|nr:hypothetical protein [Parerythrobacter aestuarii]
MIRTFAIIAIAALLASCVGGPPRTPKRVIDRALAGSNIAVPGEIVATESAFARMAREEGQWTAFREFSADGALIHGRNGAIDARRWLSTQKDPEEAVEWGPRAVWMSCNGRLAVSHGRFRDPEGLLGRFITVWQRQPDGEYRWIYDGGAPDNPQPPPRRVAGDTPDDVIVVTGMDMIEGHVADCDTPPLGADDAAAWRTSSDGTLRWQWSHSGDGQRSFSAQLWQDEAWQEALSFDYPAPLPDQ